VGQHNGLGSCSAKRQVPSDVARKRSRNGDRLNSSMFLMHENLKPEGPLGLGVQRPDLQLEWLTASQHSLKTDPDVGTLRGLRLAGYIYLFIFFIFFTIKPTQL
jgi:hypothetical protein